MKVKWTGCSPGCVTQITLPSGRMVCLAHGDNDIPDDIVAELKELNLITAETPRAKQHKKEDN